MHLRLFAQKLARVGITSALGFAQRSEGKLTKGIAALTFAVIAATTSNQPSYAGKNKFFCEQEGSIPVTKVRTSRGNETFIRWVVEDFKKSFPNWKN